MNNTVNQSSRHRQIAYINVAKALAIFLVCTYHFSWASGVAWSETMTIGARISRAIYQVATACVPLFFMCSGALLVNSPRFNDRKNLRRAGITYVQFVIWATITVVAIGWYTDVLDQVKWQHYLGQYLGIYSITVDGQMIVDTGHLWFIPTYIGIVLLVPFFRAVLYGSGESMTSYLGILIILVVSVHVIGTLSILFQFSDELLEIPLIQGAFTPFGKRVGGTVAYTMIGALAHKHRDWLTQRIPLVAPALGLLIGIVAFFGEWEAMARTGTPRWDSIYQGYFTLSGFVISVSLFLILMIGIRDVDKPNPAQRIADIVSRNTLTIYYVHFILGYTILAKFSPYVHGIGIVRNYQKALIMVVISVIMGELLRRIKPTRFLAG